MRSSTSSALGVLRRLVAVAELPAVAVIEPADPASYGLDNRLTLGVLEDGQAVLLRQNSDVLVSPRPRVDFLRRNGIPMPNLYAADDAGNSLWEFIPGRPLADLVATGACNDTVWHQTGAALATVHAVIFPAPLQGPINAESVTLRPVDPVDQLQEKIQSNQRWAERHRPPLVHVLDRVASFTAARSAQIRAERPTVTHGDVNLLNIIAGPERVQLIDWDNPLVRYPLIELAALDEHAYLHGYHDGLPAAFFTGYGREVPADLLLAYRIVGCIGWLSGDDWTAWQNDPALPDLARKRTHRWHTRLQRWADETPNLIGSLA